jgi:cytochrome c biogenesis protein CcmG, thiol:disulfide interchange protein DsbE
MRLRVIGWTVGGGLMVVLMGSLGWGLVHPANPSPITLVGRVAPDLTIATLDGRELNLSTFHGTPLVVNFWASWCVPCKQEAPVLNASAHEYQGRVQFVGVDIQDTDAAARLYQADVQSPYPVGPTTRGSHFQWGVSGPPETFFVDRHGVVISKILGPVDSQRLEVYMSQLGT